MSLVTWNPTTKGTDVVLSNNNLTAYNFWQYQSVKTTASKSVGSWYLELKIDTYFNYTGIGIIDDSVATLNNTVRTNDSYYGLYQNGTIDIVYTHKTNTLGNLTGSLSVNDIVSVLLNMDAGEITFYKNGVLLAKIEGIKTNIINANIVLTTHASQDSIKPKITANFGASAFEYVPIDLPKGTKSYDGSQNLVSTTKGFVLSDGKYYYLDSANKWSMLSNEPTIQDFLDFGINNFLDVTENLWEELENEVEIIYFTDDISVERIFIKSEVHPYSVYDYISENPQVLAYTESTDDIIVSTATEPFDLYDEFGDSVEILYYTDNEEVAEADLVLEANWSPIDELEGDFELVTWTDEHADTAQRVLELTAIPKPQFVKLVNARKLYGYLDEVLIKDVSVSYRDEARYFVKGQLENDPWLVWNKKTSSFIKVDTSTEAAILANGMNKDDVLAITKEGWRSLGEEYLNIGVFLKDNARDTITSVVDTMSYEDFIPRGSTAITDTSFYILNTTARIQLDMVGSTIFGTLSDDDLTRVQYRVILNDQPYYPSTGEFTALTTSPASIAIELSSRDIKVNDWNTIKVEFRDSFGTIDYWARSFVGSYSGLMFKDLESNFYSNELGEVLNLLDFGIIYAGQTTIEHEVILRNQYGFDVKDVEITVNNGQLAPGMTAELSKTIAPFEAKSSILYDEPLKNEEELSFFIRLKTDLSATPEANGRFNIVAKANKV